MDDDIKFIGSHKILDDALFHISNYFNEDYGSYSRILRELSSSTMNLFRLLTRICLLL